MCEADFLRPLAHPAQAEVARAPARIQHFTLDAAAVVAHLQSQLRRAELDIHFDALRIGVMEGVRQRLARRS